MAKTKRVSVNAFERYYKAQDHSETVIKFSDEFEVSVKRTIEIVDFAAAVVSAVNSCFDENGEYQSYMEDYAFKHSVLSCYTNLSLPTKAETAYRFIYGTDVYYRVVEVIDPIQLGELDSAFRNQINTAIDNHMSTAKQELERATQVINMAYAQISEFLELGKTIAGEDLQMLTKALTEQAQSIKEKVIPIKEKFDKAEQAAASEAE